jgi:hypothetical protein
MIAALNHAILGMHLHEDRFASHARRISRWGTNETPHADAETSPLAVPEVPDPVRDVAGILISRRGFEANLAVARTADEMVGTLVDLLA